MITPNNALACVRYYMTDNDILRAEVTNWREAISLDHLAGRWWLLERVVTQKPFRRSILIMPCYGQ